jgi:acyl-CoA synthetase (AMP-forming)/AMP-acid ligase II/alpha-ketoglutarate-dependent taurine dioxygenase
VTSHHPLDLAHRVLDLAARAPSHPAFLQVKVAPDGAIALDEPITRAALVARASTLAAHMRALGLADRRVALAVHIGAEAAVLYLACQLAGVAPAMLPVPARASEAAAFATVVAPLAAAFSPELVVFDRRSFELVCAADRLDCWRGDARAQVLTEAELGDGAGDLWSSQGGRDRKAIDAPAHYLFTSGTTGRSKVVRLSRDAVVRNALYVAERWEFGAGDRLPVVGPPYHSAGLMVGLVMPLYMGAVGVFPPADISPAQPVRWLRVLGEARSTHLACGDGLLRTLLLGLPDDPALQYPALRAVIIGGEPLDLCTYDLVERHFAPLAAREFRIFTAYGMTEAAGLISTSTHPRPTRRWVRRAELERGRVAPVPDGGRGPGDRDAVVLVSCGSPSHGVVLRVVDDTGRAAAADTIGRVEFHSDCLFDGYVTDPAEAAAIELKVNAASLCAVGDEGRFFPTGDLGFLHGGELFIRGRVKEAIPIGGALVPAERIEAIARAACVAVAGHHGVAALPIPEAGAEAPGSGASAPPGELMVMQEVSTAADPEAAAAAIAAALLEALPLLSIRILLFAPDSLPRLCTSAKKLRLPAVEALQRGELVPVFSRRFIAPHAGAPHEEVSAEPAWCAADLERDRRWLLPVAEAQARALARAVRARLLAGVADGIRGVLDRARHETARGVGFAVLRGLPTGLPLDELEYMIGAIGSAIGRLMPQNPAGERLTHVYDRGVPGTRGYLSGQALAFHSDTADILALFCVRDASFGGETALVSSLRVFQELAALDARDVLATLRAGFVYAYPEAAATTPSAHATSSHGARRELAMEQRIPVFSERGGRISCRYLRAFVELAERSRGEPLSQGERRALDLFDRTAARADLQLRLRLEPGDLLLINNYSVLHSRTAFEDEPDETRKRLLLRLWINVPHFRPVIPVLRLLSERYINHLPPANLVTRAP